MYFIFALICLVFILCVCRYVIPEEDITLGFILGASVVSLVPVLNIMAFAAGIVCCITEWCTRHPDVLSTVIIKRKK